MLSDALLVAGKDLRIEARARVVANQVVPFAALALVLFAFALDADRTVLTRAAAGLFWLAVAFSALLAVQRSFAIETADNARDALRASGIDPAGVFFGKTAAVALQLAVLEALLGIGVVVLYDVRVESVLLLTSACASATIGVAAVGTLYASLASSLRVRETLLPILVLPVIAPVVLAAARACDSALLGPSADGWPWVRLLCVFAVVYSAFGALAFGALMEDA